MCSIGKHTKGKCSTERPFIKGSDLSDEERLLLRIRSSTQRIDSLCSNHKKDFLTFYSTKFKSCCDPLKKHAKPARKVVPIDIKLYNECYQVISLVPGQKICKTCKKELKENSMKLSKQTLQGKGDECEEEQPGPSGLSQGSAISVGTASSGDLPSSLSDPSYSTPPEAGIETLNETLKVLGLSPIDKKKLIHQKNYAQKKLLETHQAFNKKLSDLAEQNLSVQFIFKEQEYDEILNQLKQKFQSAHDKKTKIQVLSVLPESWSIRRIETEFGASNAMARLVKSLVQSQGILAVPEAKQGRKLDATVSTQIINFYKDSENSRILPGAKDFVSVKVNGQREHRQKVLVLSNLRELHLAFRQTFPNMKVSFSKFAELRPSECVLAGASGTHSVCVCTIHQNFKLKIDALNMEKVTENGNSEFVSYKEVLKNVVCDSPTSDCYFTKNSKRLCPNCPDTNCIRENMEVTLDSRMEDTIKFYQWTTVDRCSFASHELSAEEFIDNVLESIPNVLEHDFTAKHQSEFIRQRKEALVDGQCLVIGDFSENYQPIWQDAAQGVHWSNVQVTIHPYVIYYKENGELKHLNYVVVSDSVAHNTEAVFSFQQELLKFLKEKLVNLKHVIYFSDGAPSQYKNKKNMNNLRHHLEDFKLTAEWHFFATSHGKGPCDGLGGMIKREARRESLQRVNEEPLATPWQFYEWAKTKFKDSVVFSFVSAECIEHIKTKFHARFSSAPDVEGIRSYHAVKPLSKNVLLLKTFSQSPDGEILFFGNREDKPLFSDLWGYVITFHENNWWVAKVTERIEASSSLELSFLHPHGPSRFFALPSPEKKVVKSINDIICAVNVHKDNLRVKISQADSNYAKSEHLKRFSTHRPKRRRQ